MHNVFSPKHHPTTCVRFRARRGNAIQVSSSASDSCRSLHVHGAPENRTESRQPCQRRLTQRWQYSQHLQSFIKRLHPHQIHDLASAHSQAIIHCTIRNTVHANSSHTASASTSDTISTLPSIHAVPHSIPNPTCVPPTSVHNTASHPRSAHDTSSVPASDPSNISVSVPSGIHFSVPKNPQLVS